MKSYQNFLDRINSFEKCEFSFDGNRFIGNPSIYKKVDNNNKFQAFYGDTIVFNLDDITKKKLSKIVENLYSVAPECFCEKLISNTFHMTLHDLSNSPNLQEVAAEVFENELKVIERLDKVNVQKIKMKSTYFFNMVNTSLVLGLCPMNEAEYAKLMELYGLFDGVKQLDYPLTPHITLAYYSVNGFDMKAVQKLEALVNELNTTDMEIELDIKQLYYQKFISMNEYINVVNLGKEL